MLSFYEHNRQSYSSNSPLSPELEGEFMVGGYVDEGGVDERGEFAIALERFNNGELGIQLRVFDDAHGALFEAIRYGVLRAIEKKGVDDSFAMTTLLLDCGLRDRSHTLDR